MDKQKKNRIKAIAVLLALLLCVSIYLFSDGVSLLILTPEQKQLRTEFERLVPGQSVNAAQIFQGYDTVCFMGTYADRKGVFGEIDYSKFQSHFTGGLFGMGYYNTDAGGTGLYLVKNKMTEKFVGTFYEIGRGCDPAVDFCVQITAGIGCHETTKICAKRMPKTDATAYELALSSCGEAR